ncbi:MAG TPA: hypothetical protein PK445_00420 [Methanolinea sp.]|nr:hypothetical protein [Methanolinea sp.]HQE84863.1 hypothetical protein [Methanolinea sp.]HQI13817.1 hypothetical protein [Methanolinea sp.]HQJ17876.1 hypothetical protein [Methanolinea sp.]
MAGEWVPDALIEQKMGQTKREMMDYIEKNSEKIDSNLPVFFGHVVSILENNFPDIPDQVYDRFIDDVTVKVLEESKRSTDVEYIERLFRHATRVKRKYTGRAIFDIVLGLKLIDIGKYKDAIDILMKYRTVDAIVCTAIAFCYYELSALELPPDQRPDKSTTSSMALSAREQMIELARLQPPVNRLRFPQVIQELRVNKIFWFMIKLAIDWFPDQPVYLKIGLEKAKKDQNRDMRGELLKIAAERYYSDMFFLRDLYHFKLEARDAGGATAVVRQMMQQHPDELEPLYYGLQLAIMSSQDSAYQKFRSTAISKKMPAHVILLLDLAFFLISGRRTDAEVMFEDMEKKLPALGYYLEVLDYLMQDIFSEDEKRSKTARKVFMDSIDQYCLKLIKMKED